MALAPSLQDMVAFLYPGGRPSSARQATGELRHTTIKLIPRQGMTAAWRDQLMDACNVHGCARLLDECVFVWFVACGISVSLHSYVRFAFTARFADLHIVRTLLAH